MLLLVLFKNYLKMKFCATDAARFALSNAVCTNDKSSKASGQ